MPLLPACRYDCFSGYVFVVFGLRSLGFCSVKCLGCSACRSLRPYSFPVKCFGFSACRFCTHILFRLCVLFSGLPVVFSACRCRPRWLLFSVICFFVRFAGTMKLRFVFFGYHVFDFGLPVFVCSACRSFFLFGDMFLFFGLPFFFGSPIGPRC